MYTKVFFFITSCLGGENNSWFGSYVSSGDRCQPNDTEYFPILILGKLKEDHMLCRRAWRLFDKFPLKWADSKVKLNWENLTWLISGKETISLTFHIIKMKVKCSFLKALSSLYWDHSNSFCTEEIIFFLWWTWQMKGFKITLNIVQAIAANVLYPALLYDDIQRVI